MKPRAIGLLVLFVAMALGTGSASGANRATGTFAGVAPPGSWYKRSCVLYVEASMVGTINVQGDVLAPVATGSFTGFNVCQGTKGSGRGSITYAGVGATPVGRLIHAGNCGFSAMYKQTSATDTTFTVNGTCSDAAFPPDQTKPPLVKTKPARMVAKLKKVGGAYLVTVAIS